VAHDFNNLLSVIMGHAELALAQVQPTEAVHDDLREIRTAAERSADLTRQLLAFARRQTAAPKVLDLNETVGGMLNMLRRILGEDIDVAWIPGPDIGPVRIDPSQVNQILANLCVNARDAVDADGKITIETTEVDLDEGYCTRHADAVPGRYVLLSVADNGCGMPTEVLASVFEPFFTTKERGKGTGLGLSTVYGIVKQNGGHIGVDSEPGSGTSFKIYLPRLAGTDAQAVENTRRPADAHGPVPRRTVLLVEDEPGVLKVGRRMLERPGFTVVAAGSPNEAIRLAAEHAGHIDLLLTDVVMPEMNGRQLAERLTQSCPGLKVLFMSGYTANVIARHGVLDGNVQLVEKPLSESTLADKIRDVLAGA
jgi:two-component system cell cycle sensor histidine kinase/response regulator CckA